MTAADKIIWMRPEKPARGKAPAHSREDIAAVAVRIADSEGIDAVSMRRIAKELGAGTMTLYRYVLNKDELHALMCDSLMGGVDADEFPATDSWRAHLGNIGHGMRQLNLDHPWFATVAAGLRTPGPNALRGMEASLAALDRPELSIDEIFRILVTVMTFAQGFAQNQLAETAAGLGQPVQDREWVDGEREYVTALIDSGDYPYLRKLVVEARTPHSTAAEQFASQLDLLLDGIESTVMSRAKPAPKSKRQPKRMSS